MKNLTTLELCAGGGGQALGLEQAGIEHVALVEWDRHACLTLRQNRPKWHVVQADIREFDATPYRGGDIVSGGLPCPPFSVAGKQLGDKDDRNLFPAAVRIISEVKPKAVMIENVRGILDALPNSGSQIRVSKWRSNFSNSNLISTSAKFWQSE